jgi:hypothetical protein
LRYGQGRGEGMERRGGWEGGDKEEADMKEKGKKSHE